MRRVAIGIIGLVVIAFLAGMVAGRLIPSAEAQPTGRRAITGSVRVTGIYPLAQFAAVGDPCGDDLSGSIVRITNGSGVLIGQGAVSTGVVVAVADAERTSSGGSRQSQDCDLPLSVPDLPAVDLYVVSVDDAWHGAYTDDDLDAAGWQLALVLP